MWEKETKKNDSVHKGRAKSKSMPRLCTSMVIGPSVGTKWIYNAPSGDDIDGDDDGVMNPNVAALIDLSDLSSQMLGQQVGMYSKFKIRRLWLSLRNSDDLVDQDESTYFAGTFRWWQPTKHRLRAMQMARMIEKYNEADQVDGDSFFLSTHTDYADLRFGWGSTVDFGVEQVRHQSSEAITGLPGTQWNLWDVFQAYNSMTAPAQNNALFGGRAGTRASMLPWCASAATGVGVGDAPAALTDFNSGIISQECLAGLIYLNVSHSSLDEAGAVDDDYHVVVGIEWDVGVDA